VKEEFAVGGVEGNRCGEDWEEKKKQNPAHEEPGGEKKDVSEMNQSCSLSIYSKEHEIQILIPARNVSKACGKALFSGRKSKKLREWRIQRGDPSKLRSIGRERERGTFAIW